MLAGVLVFLLRNRIEGTWLLVACAVGLTMITETANELVEWRFIRGSDAGAQAYYDLVADLGTTPSGALVGAIVAVLALAVRDRSRSA